MFDQLKQEIFSAHTEQEQYSKFMSECRMAYDSYNNQKTIKLEEERRISNQKFAEVWIKEQIEALKERVKKCLGSLESKKDITKELENLEQSMQALANQKAGGLDIIKERIQRFDAFLDAAPSNCMKEICSKSKLCLANQEKQSHPKNCDELIKRFVNMLAINRCSVQIQYREGRLVKSDPSLPRNCVRVWQESTTYGGIHIAFEFNLNGVRCNRFVAACCAPPNADPAECLYQESGDNREVIAQRASFCLLQVYTQGTHPKFQDDSQKRWQNFRKKYSQLCQLLNNKDYFIAMGLLQEPEIVPESYARTR